MLLRTNKILVVASGAAVFLTACAKNLPCEESRKQLFTKQAEFIITDAGPAGFAASMTGVTTLTHKTVEYIDYDGLYHYIHVNSEVGDTLIKKKGQSSFLIKKTNINVLIDYKCQENEVIGIIVDTTDKI